MTACVNFSTNPAYGYSEGYYRAANILVDWINQNQTNQDTLVYPILFLYRHHLELSLKRILEKAKQLGIRESVVPHGHKLIQLWAETKSLLIQLAGGKHDIWYDSITDFVAIISEIDPNSESFRYAVQTDGKQSLEGITHINLDVMYDIMESVSGYLSASIDYMNEIPSFQAEFNQDNRP